jgi:D-alanyl-lipoteichoic acid acyltransferase DltB (MBOAT superfamily)
VNQNAPSLLAARGVAAAKPDPEAVHWGPFGLLLLQLVALSALIFFYQIENEAFARLFALTTAGFALHYHLPLRWRLHFLTALSLAGLVLVLGAVNAAWIVGIGLVILAVAHIPIPIPYRAVLLVAIGLALALPRWGWGSVPWSGAIWPILGSLFVFRLFSYLYDLHHGMKPGGVAQVLSYFFMLPNVCFPLFPIVDYKRYSRSYYDAERHTIYQVGIEWIWRGVLQLVLYRLVYFQLTLDPVDVANVGELALYILSTFLLYVRLSGYFHVVMGMLRLFGFNLPETHHRYFLASSFTDYWRRINIYWKDFMLKTFYYPTFFRLRKSGETMALVVATIVTFVVTWTLHMVQWFWIRGSILVEWNDIIFWSLFGALVLVNSLYEGRYGRERALAQAERTFRDSLGVVIRTVLTFITIAIMWSFWSAESVTDWYLMVVNAMQLPDVPAWQWAALAAGFVFAIALWSYGVWKNWGTSHPPLTPTVSPARILATTALLFAVAAPPVTTSLGERAEIVDSLRLASASALNKRDAEAFQRGYYENLVDVGKFNSELAARYQQMPQDFVRSLGRLGLARQTRDAQDYELVPSKEGRFIGAMVRTNRWGMRDRDYTKERLPGTVRIALLGPSTAMGSGVEAEQGFEAILEERLNRESRDGVRYEVLNFGVAGYTPLHSMFQLERKVVGFRPDVVLFLAHVSDIAGTSRQLTELIGDGQVPAGTYLADVARQTGITADTRPTEARRRMKPFVRPLQEWVYREVVRVSRANGATPYIVYMQTVTEPTEKWRVADRLAVLGLARGSGAGVIDLTGAYGSHKPEELWIAPNDGHPNALGNQLVADRLYELLSPQLNRRDLSAAR